jgi:hypothetical protein
VSAKGPRAHLRQPKQPFFSLLRRSSCARCNAVCHHTCTAHNPTGSAASHIRIGAQRGGRCEFTCPPLGGRSDLVVRSDADPVRHRRRAPPLIAREFVGCCRRPSAAAGCYSGSIAAPDTIAATDSDPHRPPSANLPARVGSATDARGARRAHAVELRAAAKGIGTTSSAYSRPWAERP